jgi:hypothetical protein
MSMYYYTDANMGFISDDFSPLVLSSLLSSEDGGSDFFGADPLLENQ